MLGTRMLGLLAVLAMPGGTGTLDQQVAGVLPKPDEERWLAIPWRTNLMQARLDSQRIGKPLFLWIMNGNPLGCT